jgi:hypothetical protein
MSAANNSSFYDVVPYPRYSFVQTHPDRLRTVATLFGLESAPVESCRVLEMGCYSGHNLIAMALALPESSFVGVDLAGSAIEEGKRCIAELGLRNIRLVHLDICDITPDFGEFDYIIAHGVYSWVPEKVRQALLRVFRSNLATSGVAYVSHNCYPGFYMRRMMREMMQHHVRGIQDPETRFNEGMALVKFLLAARKQTDENALLLKTQLDRMERRGPFAVLHDELADVDDADYFKDFMARVEACGLRYLGDSEYFTMGTGHLSEVALQALDQFGPEDEIEREQYLDFIWMRSFRQTLLCRQHVALNRSISPPRMRDYFFSSHLKHASETPSLAEGQAESFSVPDMITLSLDGAWPKAVLVRLAQRSPGRPDFQELAESCRAALGDSYLEKGPQAEECLCGVLLGLYRLGAIFLHSFRPKLPARAAERPLASPLARWQLRTERRATTLYHTTVGIEDDLTAQLIQLLDGTRDRPALLAALRQWAAETGTPCPQDISPEGLEAVLNSLLTKGIILA